MLINFTLWFYNIWVQNFNLFKTIYEKCGIISKQLLWIYTIEWILKHKQWGKLIYKRIFIKWIQLEFSRKKCVENDNHKSLHICLL